MRQYKRTYSLEIGGAEQGLVIDDLRVRFSVTKSLAGLPNSVQIDIFNLSETSRKKIQNEFTDLFLKVGYDGRNRLLFSGQIKNVVHLKQAPDYITTIYAGDGQRSWEQAVSSFTLGEGTTVNQILREVVKDFKEVSLGLVKGLTGNEEKVQGYSAAKPSRQILNELANEYEFSWSIENKVLKIVEDSDTEDQEFLINAATGMINSPAITEKGVQVKTLLNPRIIPFRRVRIDSISQDVQLGNLNFTKRKITEATGVYKVLQTVHTGDTHSNDWFTDILGRPI